MWKWEFFAYTNALEIGIAIPSLNTFLGEIARFFNSLMLETWNSDCAFSLERQPSGRRVGVDGGRGDLVVEVKRLLVSCSLRIRGS